MLGGRKADELVVHKAACCDDIDACEADAAVAEDRLLVCVLMDCVATADAAALVWIAGGAPATAAAVTLACCAFIHIFCARSDTPRFSEPFASIFPNCVYLLTAPTRWRS
jgi:hypothetical protein